MQIAEKGTEGILNEQSTEMEMSHSVAYLDWIQSSCGRVVGHKDGKMHQVRWQSPESSTHDKF